MLFSCRDARYMERRKKRSKAVTTMEYQSTTVSMKKDIDNEEMFCNIEDSAVIQSDESLRYADKEYGSNDSHRDVQIQTEITEFYNVIIMPIMTPKKSKDKRYETSRKASIHQPVNPISVEEMNNGPSFTAISSVKNDQQLLDLVGVTFDNCNFLFKRLLYENAVNQCKISKKDKLFIFLEKVKTDSIFSDICVLFLVHRVTIREYFF